MEDREGGKSKRKKKANKIRKRRMTNKSTNFTVSLVGGEG